MLDHGERRRMKIVVSSGAEAGRAYEVDRALTIGRATPAEILLSDPRVSGRHAVLRPVAGGVTIEDAGSSNGTYVDDLLITGPRELRGGEVIRVGDTALQVSPSTPTVSSGPAPWQLVVRTGPDAGANRSLSDGETLLIGRDPKAALVLADSRVSNQHASVTLDGGVVTVRDLGSANGTLLNGTPVRGRVPVPSGSEIQVGESVIVASLGAVTGSGPTPTVIGSVPVITSEGPGSRSRGKLAAAAMGGLAAVAGVAVGGLLLFRDDDSSLTPAQVVRANRDATVMVLNKQNGELRSSGSGFVVDRDKGLIVTNNHVAAGGELAIQPEAARGSQLPAKLVAAMPCEDLALVKIEDQAALKAMRQVTFATTTYDQGDPVVALGYPGSAESGRTFGTDSLSATSGIVSKVEARYDVPLSGVPLLTSVIQHSAAVNPGNSGGPLFDDRGHLIGVNTAIYFGGAQRAENESYAVTAKRLRDRLAGLERGDSPKWLGIALGSTFRSEATGEPLGVTIAGITPGSSAERAGVPLDGIIVGINGRQVRDLQEYCEAVPEREGDEATLVIGRVGFDPIEVRVRVGNDG